MRSFAFVLTAALALAPAVTAAPESHALCTKSKHVKAFGHNKPHHTVEHHHHKHPKHTTTSHKPAKTHTEHSKTSKSKTKTSHKASATAAPANQLNVSHKSRVPFRSRTKTAAPTTTQAKPGTTQAAPPAATTSAAAPSGDSVQAISLQKHNDLRAKHHAPALTWNTDLANAAQAWANKCVFPQQAGVQSPRRRGLSRPYKATPSPCNQRPRVLLLNHLLCSKASTTALTEKLSVR